MDGTKGPAPWHQMDSIFGARSAKEHAEHLLPFLRPNMKVLDVGCGLGTITLDIARIVSPGHVIGIDTDSTSISKAKKLAQTHDVTNVEFSEGTAYDLSFLADESMDIVHAHQVILHLKEPVKALIEIHRVLKKNGILSLRDNVRMYFVPADSRIEQLYKWFCDFSTKQGSDPHGGLRHHIWANEAGFAWDRIQTKGSSFEFSGDPKSRRVWCDGTKTGFKDIGLKMGYGTESEYDEIKKAWENWALNDAGRAIGFDSALIARK